MNKTALVTGASSGIGRAIVMRLLLEGYEVYGIGRSFDHTDIEHPAFHVLICDLLDEQKRNAVLKEVPQDSLTLLVNNAGCAYYGMHETLNANRISEMVRIDLEVPMILSAFFLRALRKNRGTIINIASITAESVNTHGAAYGAAKAGLLSFSKSLFEENRKYGLKVSAVLPDMTDTNLYRNADFEADREEGCSLAADDVAEAVSFILSQKEGVTVPTITIRPQYHRIQKKRKV